MKLGMDVRMIRHSGIGVRIQNILKFWKPISGVDLYLFGEPEILKSFQLPSHKEVIPYKAEIYSFQELFGHPRMKDMDLLDIPHFNVPLRYLQKCVVTIHDLIPYVMKDYHSSLQKRIYLNLVLRSILRYAKMVFAVSQFTRDDILQNFPNTFIPIETAYNGVDLDLYQKQPKAKVKKFQKKYKLPDQFLLTVGIGKGHKNHEFLLKALISLWKGNPKIPPLVVAGTGGQFPVELQRLVATELEFLSKKLILLPRLETKEMPLLYQSASIYIHPSLYEGFGFPPLEAQAMGTLVLSSHASCLPEILGKGAVYFHPQSLDDFQTKLLNLFNSLQNHPNSLQEIRRIAIQNAKQFRWQDTVDRIQGFYKKF